MITPKPPNDLHKPTKILSRKERRKLQAEKKAQDLKERRKKVEIDEQLAIERGSNSAQSSQAAASKMERKYRTEGGLSGDVDGLLKINKKGEVDW